MASAVAGMAQVRSVMEGDDGSVAVGSVDDGSD
jgi:hypothetical protein